MPQHDRGESHINDSISAICIITIFTVDTCVDDKL